MKRFFKYFKYFKYKTKKPETSPPKKIKENLFILICDDTKINRFILQKFLISIDNTLKIDEAVNGKEALEMSKKNNYDIIFMDIIMPVMSGYEASKLIKNHNSNIKIIAVTGQVERISRDKMESNKIDHCLSKPIDKKLLEIILNNVKNNKKLNFN